MNARELVEKWRAEAERIELRVDDNVLMEARMMIRQRAATLRECARELELEAPF